jgi:hypothetical protein
VICILNFQIEMKLYGASYFHMIRNQHLKAQGTNHIRAAILTELTYKDIKVLFRNTAITLN